MATVSEIAKAVREVGVRARQSTSNFGWGLNISYSDLVGGSIPITAETFSGYADIVANRVERITKTQIEADDFWNMVE